MQNGSAVNQTEVINLDSLVEHAIKLACRQEIDEPRAALKSTIAHATKIIHTADEASDTYHRADEDFERGQKMAITTLSAMFSIVWAERERLQGPTMIYRLKQIPGGWRFQLEPNNWMEVYHA